MPEAEEKIDLITSHLESHGSIKGPVLLIEGRFRERIPITFLGINKTNIGSHHMYLAILYNSLLSGHRRS